jgi:hypothetical protein
MFLAGFFVPSLSCLEAVGSPPSECAESAPTARFSGLPDGIDPILLEELWRDGDAASCGLGLRPTRAGQGRVEDGMTVIRQPLGFAAV